MPYIFQYAFLHPQFPTLMQELLNAIYQIGEDMRITLAENRLENFYGLLEKRQQAIEQLSIFMEKSAPSNEIQEKFSQLEEQFSGIMQDLQMKEQEMLQALNNLQNLKHAQRSYSFDRKPYRFIRNNISG